MSDCDVEKMENMISQPFPRDVDIIKQLEAENKTLTIFLETLEERLKILKTWLNTTSTIGFCDECIKDIDHYLKLHKEETK